MIEKEDFQNIINKVKEHKCKHKKVLTYVGIILFIYLLLICFAKRIETIATFPAIGINVQDLVGYADYDLVFEEINIKDNNGNNINGLFVDAGTGSKVVYYFHGNGGPISYFYSEINYINSLGYSVMAYDYPGYGKSTGFPYKEVVDDFSDSFYKYMKVKKNIKDDELILWGYSVGTAVVTDFATKNNFERLVLISPFSSRYDMVKKLFGFNLSKFLFLDESYNTKALVKYFDKPVLIIHGNNDNIVPFNQGKLVFNNYAGGSEVLTVLDKSFIEIDNFGHNGIIDIYGNALEGIFTDFLNGKVLDFKNNYFLLNKEAKSELELINNRLNYINGLDLESDNSITKFVNSTVSFNDKAYIPENLEKIGSKYVYDSKGGRQIITEEANNSLQRLAEKFYNEFDRKLVVVSAYRSYTYQKGIKDRGCPDNLCSKAGYSEHQSGLAVDLFEASTQANWNNNINLTKYFDWLNENAHNFGFHNTYQKGLKIDGYEIEPWHWRYVGVELASYLKENNITIAEFYFNNKD